MAAAGLALLTLLAGGCSSTVLRDSWRDPQFAGPPLRSVLVIGVARSQSNRRVFEDGFTQALRNQGVAATASYLLLPEEGAIGNARIKGAVAQSGADAVLITRVLRVQRNVHVTPGYVVPGYYAAGFYGWYTTAYTTVPPSIEQYEVLTIESTLWSMQPERVVWSGTSESTDVKDVTTLTGELAAVLIGRMREDKVL
ncbi:MAG TPA: hypothetical protein VFX14_10305 [Methylomirabilota bacterium]|nr:hypothetical protein [Methylomirabilota bacterium]